MLRAARPTAFLATTDPGRARRFFEGSLGLTLVADEEFALVFDLAGTTLRVATVDELVPQPFTVLGWNVGDLPGAIRTLTERGIAFERFAGLDQDGQGIWTAPSGTRVAWFKDPDGNLLSLSQPPQR